MSYVYKLSAFSEYSICANSLNLIKVSAEGKEFVLYSNKIDWNILSSFTNKLAVVISSKKIFLYS